MRTRALLVGFAVLATFSAHPAFAQSQNSAPRKNFPNPNVTPSPTPAPPSAHHHHHHWTAGKSRKHSR